MSLFARGIGCIALCKFAWLGISLLSLLTSGLAQQLLPLKDKTKKTLDEALVSYWNANRNTQDPKGNNDGFWVNSPGSYSISLPGLGEAFNFSGNGDFVAVPHTTSLDLNSAASLAFWTKPDSSNLMDYCCQGLVTTDFYGVEISNGVSEQVGVNFFISTGSGFIHTSDANGGGAPIAPGLWHHVAATFDGEKMQLYIDGLAWGNSVSQSGNIVPMADGSFLSFGSEDGRKSCEACPGTRYFNGLIDEIRLYSRALTPEEVQSLASVKQ